MALRSLYRQLFPEPCTERPPKAPGSERRYVHLLGHGLAELQRHHAPHSPAWEGYQAVRDALEDLEPQLSEEEEAPHAGD